MSNQGQTECRTVLEEKTADVISGRPEHNGEGAQLHAKAKEDAFKEAFSSNPFGGELYLLITKYSTQCQDIEQAKAMLGELVSHTLNGGISLGFHPIDIMKAIQDAGKAMADSTRMVCVDCEGGGKVPGVLSEMTHDCATCHGEGSIALRCE